MDTQSKDSTKINKNKKDLNRPIFKQVDVKEISLLEVENTLMIIGNGFDLMHGIPSSYYDFRDSIPQESTVKFILEVFIRADDVWGDFESNLAYLDRESMLGPFDMWFDSFGVLDEEDEDFSAADYFAAQDAATTPIYVLTQELPKSFRRWIDSLEYKGDIRPLEGLIHKKYHYINFNYTEFLETIYGVDKENILYIHGNRNDKKSELVLGHGHDIDQVFEEWYQVTKNKKEYQPQMYYGEFTYDKNDHPVYLGYFLKDPTLGNWKSQTRFDGIHNMLRLIETYYEDSAKKTEDVLQRNKEYFKKLDDVNNIIVIGHSLSQVDDPYFREIIKNNKNKKAINWYISWYNQADLENIAQFAEEMNLSNEQIRVFQV